VSIVLIGAPAAGKTRVGKRLARRLGKAFIDTDHAVTEKHGPIPEIFSVHGEPHFRTLERAEVAAALTEDAVVSLGGGAVLDPLTQADLGSATVVLLTISAEAVSERIANDKRPLVTGIDAWKALVASRSELYERLADVAIDTSFRKPDVIVEEIVGILAERGIAVPTIDLPRIDLPTIDVPGEPGSSVSPAPEDDPLSGEQETHS
jgi:shikimate kinase